MKNGGKDIIKEKELSHKIVMFSDGRILKSERSFLVNRIKPDAKITVKFEQIS